jgi:Tol biopolymer transport system component
VSALDGKNPRTLGEGFKDNGFPAVSPDGKKLLWLRVAQSASLTPELLDLTTSQTTKLPVGEGLWTQPVWR